nr:integrase, catalytic region, zinc finger, CCHC-type, peptidase aspartic, catalytic [Tanacetum cinerariifolium]
KEIAKPIIPLSESTSEEDSDPEQPQRDKDMQKNLALIAKYFKKIYKPTNNNLRTSSNSRNKNVDTTPSLVVQQIRIQCFNCKEFGHFAKECRKPKRFKDSTYHMEKMLLCKQAEKGVPLQAEQFDWLAYMDEDINEQDLEAHYSYMAKIQEVPTTDSCMDSEPSEQVQNDAGYNVFANEIQHSEQSESICNTCLVETGDSNVILDLQDMCDNVIQNDQNAEECDDERVAVANLIANLKLDVDENKKIQKKLKKENTTLAQELIKCKSILAETGRTLGNLITQNDSFIFVHELKQKMYADLKYVESFEKEIEELGSDKVEFSNICYTELQCLYLHKVKECDCLEQKLSKQIESVSKEVYTELLRSSGKLEKHSISLELSLQKCKEQMKNDTVCKEKASNVFQEERKQYFEIQDLKAQLQEKNIAICELKKLIEKLKGKSVETKFDKPSIIQQPNAQRIPKSLVLGKPAPFLDYLERKHFSKTKSVPKTNVLEGVIHKTSVSIPHHRSTKMKDKVMPNNSQVKDKKTKVEDHPRISNISNNTKSVTASNDSLKSRTLNVNVVCDTCGKCLVPISTRKPKGHANESVATPCKKKVASESTTQKSKSYYRMLYGRTSKAWKWWIEQKCPTRYKWVPKTKIKWVPKVRNENVTKKIVQLILFIVDSGCTKHMTGNITLLCNFVEKCLGTVRFGNDQFALILLYGGLVQGNITINMFYYIEGLNHNLFLVGQFCDTDLEVAF